MQIRFDAVVDVTEVGVEPQNQWDAEASKEPIVVAKTRRPVAAPATAWQEDLGLRILLPGCPGYPGRPIAGRPGYPAR